MTLSTTALESDLAALKRTGGRAGAALASLFSPAEELQADAVPMRRQRGRHASSRSQFRAVGRAMLSLALAFALLLV